MIEFTIKTLDSTNHSFSVEDETTVQQLKEKVMEQMGIEVNLQRLIFCGRVMQDEKKLSEYDVHGKVVHLVQRAPPCSETRGDRSNPNGVGSNNEPNANSQQQMRRMMGVDAQPDFQDQVQQITMTPTAGRLEFIRRMITDIRTAIETLTEDDDGEENRSAPASSDVPVETLDNEHIVGATQEEPSDDRHTEDNAGSGTGTGARNGPGSASETPSIRQQNARRRAMRALRARSSRPRDLGQLLDDLENLHVLFAPYRHSYVRMLRAANNTEPPLYTEEERQFTQRIVDIVSDIMHSFAHAYHAISDINFQVGQRVPRLTSEPSVIRHQLPMQAHINVVQSARRPPQAQTVNGAAPGNTTGDAPASQTTPPAQGGPPRDLNNQDAQNQAAAQLLPDLEHLFRGLSQAGGIGGVEVVMSMEELPLGGTLGVGTIFTGNNSTSAAPGAGTGTGTGPTTRTGLGTNASTGTGNNTAPGANTGSGSNNFGQSNSDEVYLPFVPWGPPSAEMLQSLMYQMLRQGPDGVSVQFPLGNVHHFAGDTVTMTPIHQIMQAANQIASQQANSIQPHLQQIFQTQYIQPQQNAPQSQQPAAQTAPTSQTQQSDQQPAQAAQDTNNRNTQPHLHIRRATTTTTRAQALSIANCIYDRYLYCDSSHARRRLQRRRDQHAQQVAAQERLRAERNAALHIAALRDRNLNLTENNIMTMVQLLNSVPSLEAWMNAFFVTIARHLYLRNVMANVPGEPLLVPSEFIAIRAILRNYIQNLLDRSGHVEGQLYAGVADFLVAQHADFIINMSQSSQIRADIDIYMTIRGFVRSRLPAIIACSMRDLHGESTYAPRFYSLITRIYTDFCALITLCLEDGVTGLRVVYRLFLEHMVKNFDSSVRQSLLNLAEADLNGVINTLGSTIVRQYIHRREPVNEASALEGAVAGPSPLQPSAELSPPVEEAMQTSPRPVATVSDTQERSASPMPDAIEHVSEVSQPSTSTVTTAVPTGGTQTVSSTSTYSPLSSPSRTSARVNKEKSESSTPTQNGNREENLRFVPPLMIVQHWGEEWVPVFTRDQQAQRPEPQAPYSDAYLSGMPSRKRRCVRQSRTPTTLDGFMNDSVREAADRDRSSTLDNSAMRNAFREHMRNIARTRASSSDDYDPRQYASASRFLNPTNRSNKQQPQESGNVNKEEE